VTKFEIKIQTLNKKGIHQFTLTIVVDIEIWRGKEEGTTLMERQLDPEFHFLCMSN